MDRQYGYAAGTSNMDKQHGNENGHPAWTYSNDVTSNMEMQH
jgi:hypothetical protein